MITSDLFNNVLINPILDGARRLFIVTGYATPALVYRHFEEIEKRSTAPVSIKMIVGMSALEGVNEAYHKQFVQIASVDYVGRFECSYVTALPPVHSKTYAWFSNEIPRIAYTGSVNYSHNGFFYQREAVTTDSPVACYKYYQSLIGEAVNCLDPDVADKVKITDEPIRRARRILRTAIGRTGPSSRPSTGTVGYVQLSLLNSRTGETHTRAGLNWGQRAARDPNQAYIPVPSHVARSGFFPPRGQHFSIMTDDGKSFDAVIAQGGDKAIETPRDNSILGLYFRERMGLSSGAYVARSDLRRYGRTDVDFLKLDSETYLMDFS